MNFAKFRLDNLNNIAELISHEENVLCVLENAYNAGYEEGKTEAKNDSK